MEEKPSHLETGAIDFAFIARRLREGRLSIPANLVDFMAERSEGQVEDVAQVVHDDRDASDRTIRKNIDRTNKALEKLNCRLSFRMASGRIFREISPE